MFIRFPEKGTDSKLLEVWSDNPEIELKLDEKKACTFTMNEEMDELKPYLKKIYITLLRIIQLSLVQSLNTW